MANNLSVRWLTEDELKKRDVYSVGTLHRASTLAETNPSQQAEASAAQSDLLDLQNLPEDPILGVERGRDRKEKEDQLKGQSTTDEPPV